jgi:hypothetical protein
MPWNPIWPNGAVSVKQNTVPGQQNTAYIETTLNNDHYWNISADEDGHHKFVQTVGTNDADTTLPTNCALAANLDLVYYSRYKTATEAPIAAQQTAQPYIKNAGADATPWLLGVMQLLGMQACGCFSVAGGALTTIYTHNCTLTRDALGRFHADFITAIPTVNYFFLGGAMPNNADTNAVMSCAIESDVVLTNNKTANLVKFRTVLTTGSTTINRSLADPQQAWFFIFGG